MTERLKQEFLKRVSPEPTSGCWLWVGDGRITELEAEKVDLQFEKTIAEGPPR